MATNNSIDQKIELITDAIERRLVITFRDEDGKKRAVEPFTLGIHKDTGKYVVRCYKNFYTEVQGEENSWTLFEVEKIQRLEIMPVLAQRFRDGYAALDSEMSEIISFTLHV